jgi:streptogramin lyase
MLARIDPATGHDSRFALKANLSVPTDIVIDEDLNVYVADPNYSRVVRYSTIADRDAEFIQGESVFSLGLDSDGNVYAAGKKYAPSGEVIASGFVGAAYGIAVDTHGDVYLADGVYNDGWSFALKRYQAVTCP